MLCLMVLSAIFRFRPCRSLITRLTVMTGVMVPMVSLQIRHSGPDRVSFSSIYSSFRTCCRIRCVSPLFISLTVVISLVSWINMFDYAVGGYRRRQFRFFFFRLLSQAVAMFLYLSISPVLRFGLNKEYTPFSGINGEDYRNSMIYAAVNLVFIFFVAFLGYMLLRSRHHQTYHGSSYISTGP